ncbi:MAG TPA: type IV secretory system conjugative DNA transfer family protein [Acidimicrobiales bacterium]|nr:type IV secretory system conjugative DNA transfer family protein [Acidimicrobiales bacterium]
MTLSGGLGLVLGAAGVAGLARTAGPGPWRRPPGPQRRRPAPGRRPRSGTDVEPARWARRRDLGALLVRAPAAGRLTLGRWRRRLVAAEPGHSVLVVGPTQSRKTSGFAVPAILEWEGPVVAASVKSDLARHTAGWRGRMGRVAVYDPTGATGMAPTWWSPLHGAGTWEGARGVAASLTEVARSSAGSLTDGDFWYATAAKLLAPLLHGAALSGRTMVDVLRWLDTQETAEVAEALGAAAAFPALQAAQASWGRDERQRSAVYTTAETVLEAFAAPDVAAGERTGAGERFDPAALLDGSHTLYLCAPAHDQRRLRPLFATLVAQVVEAAYRRATRLGGPIDPPLLVVLDEAANVAPLADLDVLASTGAGHGVQLVTVWQDLAQLEARYGRRSGTVVNNHRVKVFLSGIADPGTLEHASTLVGETEVRSRTTTVDASGAPSVTDAPTPRRLVAPDALRRIAPGRAVVVSGHLPPVSLTLRTWPDVPALRRRAETAP